MDEELLDPYNQKSYTGIDIKRKDNPKASKQDSPHKSSPQTALGTKTALEKGQ